VFIAALACFLILREPREKCAPPVYCYRHSSSWLVVQTRSACATSEDSSFDRIDSDWTPPDVVVVTVSRMIIPFIQLFGLYVLAHGHYSPGGGFQAGVIFAASYVLLAVSHDLRTLVSRLTERAGHLFSAAGVLLYLGVGLVGLAAGGYLLDICKL
ncbi:MAG: MnhB domain-containing protein, partial [Syntrophobacteraceae bacterium]